MTGKTFGVKTGTDESVCGGARDFDALMKKIKDRQKV